MPRKSETTFIDLTSEEPSIPTLTDSSSDIAILRTLSDNGHTESSRLSPPSTALVVPLNSSPGPSSRRRRTTKTTSTRNDISNIEEISVVKTVKLPGKLGSSLKPKEVLIIPESDPIQSTSSSSSNDNKRCPICFDNLRNPSVTLCGHVYCTECILAVARTTKQCPICRKKMTSKGFHPIFL